MKTKVSTIAAAAALASNLSVAQVSGSTSPMSTAVGVGATAAVNGTAVGALANAGPQGAAYGGNANANAQGAIAIGGCINIICVDAATGAVVNNPLPVGVASTAIGSGSLTPAERSTAVGSGASALHTNSVALGSGSHTTRDQSLEVGGRQITGVVAGSVGSDAVNVDQFNNGLSSSLSQARAYADGKSVDVLNSSRSHADAKATEALSGANAYTDKLTRYFAATSDGAAPRTGAPESVAFGPGASASGNGSIAGGLEAAATADNTVVFGRSANAAASSSTAIGHEAKTLASNSTAVGHSSTAENPDDVALGSGSITSGAVGTAEGIVNGSTYKFAGPSPTSTVSVGAPGTERTVTNVAAGRILDTSTDAVNGSQLSATNTALSELGRSVEMQGSSTARSFGAGASYDPISGEISSPTYTINGIDYANVGSALGALGTSVASNNSENLSPAVATGRNSVALGPGSIADRDHTVSIGAAGAERQLTNVAPGTAPTDATSLGQVTSLLDRNSRGDRAYTDERVNALDARSRKRTAGVGAMALAASALVPNARAEGRTSLSAAIGTYGGESAFAAGLNYHVSNQVILNARLALATDGPAKGGAAVGLTWGF